MCASVLAAVPVGAAAADATPPGIPGSIQAAWNTTTPTTLDVTWTSPGSAYLTYEVLYRTDSGDTWDPAPGAGSSSTWSSPERTTATAASLTGLDAGLTYVVAVRAHSRVTGLYGSWGYSGLVVPAGTPAVVSGVSASGSWSGRGSNSSLGISWTAATGIGHYDVRWTAHPPAGLWSTAAVSTSSATLTGLDSSKRYVARVRSKSASGTCGQSGVKCSRWVESAPLARLDINGLSAAKKLAGTDPSHMRESDRAWDLEVTWDEVPAASEYRAQFYWRAGKPSDYYDKTDDNTSADAMPDDWHQDWEWYYDCNDADASNDPDRGCNDPFTGTTPYEKPVWAFGPAAWDADVEVPTTACASGTCTWTFADSTIAWAHRQCAGVGGRGQRRRRDRGAGVAVSVHGDVAAGHAVRFGDRCADGGVGEADLDASVSSQFADHRL